MTPLNPLQALLDFWLRPEGIMLRLAFLEDETLWHTFNESVKAAAEEWGVNKFLMAGPIDERICDICVEYAGEVFSANEYMIRLPVHPNCRHWWDLVVES